MSETEEREPTSFIWTVEGEPVVGSLQKYASQWQDAHYYGLHISSTVLTWDNKSDPITWNVKVTPIGKMDNGYADYNFSVPGLEDTASVRIDSGP